jgi:hypothetical protein
MTVTIATAAIERLPARTFYVSTLSPPTMDRRRRYVVKWMHQRVTCTCPDYVHRGQVLRRPCKHTRLVRQFAREAGGLKNIPRGITVHVPWKER